MKLFHYIHMTKKQKFFFSVFFFVFFFFFLGGGGCGEGGGYLCLNTDPVVSNYHCYSFKALKTVNPMLKR